MAHHNEAIRRASANGRLQVVKDLLSQPGADSTANNNEAIREASRRSNLEVVKELLLRPGVDSTADYMKLFDWNLEMVT